MCLPQVKHDKFEKLIHAYMADPQNNRVLELKGPVVRVIIHRLKKDFPGWLVDFYCEQDPSRSFDLEVSLEDLYAWMWENSARIQPHE
jgi:hypothetical protein